jgi:osmoprotectant transport system permease protein
LRPRITALLACAWLLVASIGETLAAPLAVGSKRFTESYILGEIVRQAAQAAGETPAEHRQGLGNTAIVLNALTSGSIDVYAEYTGTIAREILKLDSVPPLAELNTRLAAMGLAAAVPLGFNDTYALAIRGDDAQAKGIATLSDLARHPELRLGLTQEFIGRADGWPGLKRAYALPFDTPRGLDHGIAYDALAAKQVDVIDIYSTDAKIARYGVRVLADDRRYFPPYDAVLLHRADLPTRLPRTWAALRRLEGRIDEAAMIRMNAAVELEGKDFATVAAAFLAQGPTGVTATPASPAAWSPPGAAPAAGASSAGASSAAAPSATTPAGATRAGFLAKLFAPDFARLTFEHLRLVFLSLVASVIVGIPLGVLAARRPRLEAPVMTVTGLLQTVPSLALLAALIPLTGHIGTVPALIALALYALLPIVRNTHAALVQIPAGIVQAAQSLGLESGTILRRIELPMAARTILAGIRTSAVINVGTATIAAFIGAGGYGERIVTGLALNDHAMLLAGAVPAAALALLIEGAFHLVERSVVPAGLRIAPA